MASSGTTSLPQRPPSVEEERSEMAAADVEMTSATVASPRAPPGSYQPTTQERRAADSFYNLPQSMPITSPTGQQYLPPTESTGDPPLRSRRRQWMPASFRRRREYLKQEAAMLRDQAEAEINTREIRNLEDCPEGYPRLAAFLESDSSLLVFRRFGYLQTRLLLEKQNLLAELEGELDEADQVLQEEDGRRLRSAQYGRKKPSRLPELGYRDYSEILKEIESTFHEYTKLLIDAQRMRGFETPTKRDYQSIRTMMWNTKPIIYREQMWILMKEHLLAIRPAREPDWLERMVENIARHFECQLVRRLLTTPDLRKKTNDQNIYYYSPERIQKVTTAILALFVAIILVLPILICYLLITNLSNSRAYAGCIGVVLSFTLVFAICAMGFSNAKRLEVLAATSAYCAVLVVFLGGVGKAT